MAMLKFLLFLMRKEVGDMAVVYATLIIKGVKTIDDVPEIILEQVKQVLKKLEVEIWESEGLRTWKNYLTT